MLAAFLSMPFAAVRTNPPSAAVTLTWDKSPSTNVTGYNVYRGTNSRVYSHAVSTTNLTAKMTNVPYYKTNFYAATAKDNNGLESDYSAELVHAAYPKTNVVITVTVPPTTWSECSVDLRFWVAAPGSCSMTNPLAPLCFWRGDGVTIDRRIF
jgi:fibronectin type 3 domain-containing protein